MGKYKARFETHVLEVQGDNDTSPGSPRELDAKASSNTAGSTAIRATGVVLAACVAVWLWLVVGAPETRNGPIEKILYVHVPCALAAYVGFGIAALCGALYLWRNEERYDRLALAGAEVGVVFCTLVVLSGPLWAKGTWGAWWAWDPRLVVTLLLWFIYLAYILLRGFTEGSERTARFAAVYGMVGFLAVPLNYFAIDLFGGAAMHPENLEESSFAPGMGIPFAVGMVTALVALLFLVLMRFDLATRQALEAEAVRSQN